MEQANIRLYLPQLRSSHLQETKKSVTSRAIVLILRKKAARAEYWPRLTKEKVRNQWIKTDFSKWVDEDEQDEAPAVDE